MTWRPARSIRCRDARSSCCCRCIPMRRSHSMPFGAELLPGSGVRFRLWAPAARQVELRLEPEGARFAMSAQPQGWFELVTGLAAAGTRYQFRIDGEIDVPDPASRFQPHDVR